MASELKPCPFCGGPAMECHVVEPSVQCERCPVGMVGETEAEAIERWNTRPAPAATDTGLVTGLWTMTDVNGKPTNVTTSVNDAKVWRDLGYVLTEYVTRSQAEELLAEKDERLKDWQNKWVQTDLLRLKAEADNAAKDARIKELETERTMIVSHATMGQTDGIGLTVNDISVRVTALRNKLYDEGKKEVEALGARIKELEEVHLDAADAEPGEHQEILAALEAHNSGEEQ